MGSLEMSVQMCLGLPFLKNTKRVLILHIGEKAIGDAARFLAGFRRHGQSGGQRGGAVFRRKAETA